MNNLYTSAAPHINSGSTTHKVMRDVAIALAPATIAGIVLFGVQALLLVLVCVASAVAAEFFFNLACKKKQTLMDFSAIVTGLILALNLGVDVPLWQAAVGSVFAIVIVKCLFGGLGKNIANPAIAARVFLLLAFTGTMTTFSNPQIGAELLPDFYAPVTNVDGVDLVGCATPLAALVNGDYDLLSLLLGHHGGTIGETCAIALLLGYAYLVFKGVIKWYVPFAFIATVFVLFVFSSKFDFGYALAQVLSGGLLFGAIFMATDYVTTPLSKLGKVVFCIGCGLLTFAFRTGFVGAYPEGVSISILFMNLLTPLLEKWTNPRTLGGVR